jgi:hypothetical protein
MEANKQVGITEFNVSVCRTVLCDVGFAESVPWAFKSAVTQMNVKRKIVVECPRNFHIEQTKLKLNSTALVCERTIPTERPPPVGEVTANFCG